MSGRDLGLSAALPEGRVSVVEEVDPGLLGAASLALRYLELNGFDLMENRCEISRSKSRNLILSINGAKCRIIVNNRHDPRGWIYERMSLNAYEPLRDALSHVTFAEGKDGSLRAMEDDGGREMRGTLKLDARLDAVWVKREEARQRAQEERAAREAEKERKRAIKAERSARRKAIRAKVAGGGEVGFDSLPDGTRESASRVLRAKGLTPDMFDFSRYKSPDWLYCMRSRETGESLDVLEDGRFVGEQREILGKLDGVRYAHDHRFKEYTDSCASEVAAILRSDEVREAARFRYSSARVSLSDDRHEAVVSFSMPRGSSFRVVPVAVPKDSGLDDHDEARRTAEAAVKGMAGTLTKVALRACEARAMEVARPLVEEATADDGLVAFVQRRRVRPILSAGELADGGRLEPDFRGLPETVTLSHGDFAIEVPLDGGEARPSSDTASAFRALGAVRALSDRYALLMGAVKRRGLSDACEFVGDRADGSKVTVTLSLPHHGAKESFDVTSDGFGDEFPKWLDAQVRRNKEKWNRARKRARPFSGSLLDRAIADVVIANSSITGNTVAKILRGLKSDSYTSHAHTRHGGRYKAIPTAAVAAEAERLAEAGIVDEEVVYGDYGAFYPLMPNERTVALVALSDAAIASGAHDAMGKDPADWTDAELAGLVEAVMAGQNQAGDREVGIDDDASVVAALADHPAAWCASDAVRRWIGGVGDEAREFLEVSIGLETDRDRKRYLRELLAAAKAGGAEVGAEGGDDGAKARKARKPRPSELVDVVRVERGGESRWAIASRDGGRILDDANGYGYRTERKARAAWDYKNRPPERKRRDRLAAEWLGAHRELSDLLGEMELDGIKDGAPLRAADVRDAVGELGLSLCDGVTAGDVLRAWRGAGR